MKHLSNRLAVHWYRLRGEWGYLRFLLVYQGRKVEYWLLTGQTFGL